MSKIHVLSDKKLESIIQQRLDAYKAGMEENYEMRLLMQQANIVALQSQINPHFLYNTLECIRGQAMAQGCEDIAQATFILSHYFRYNISAKEGIATIQDEFENVRNYVAIQQFRFRDRFDLTIACDAGDEACTEAVIPRLTLQPIVENAIIHGFSNITSGGHVQIRLTGSQENIRLTIKDNGCGMTVAQLLALNQKLYRKETPDIQNASASNGIAMQNVNRRIQLMFGEQYGLSIHSFENAGTEVHLLLPFWRSYKNEK